MKKLFLLFLIVLPFNVSAQEYHKYFYCIYQDDECIDPTGPVVLKRAKIELLAERVSEGEKNFIGFEDANGDTIQFYTQKINKIWIDIPAPSKNGSYGKFVDKKEFISLIKNLKTPYINYKTSLNLKFEPW